MLVNHNTSTVHCGDRGHGFSSQASPGGPWLLGVREGLQAESTQNLSGPQSPLWTMKKIKEPLPRLVTGTKWIHISFTGQEKAISALVKKFDVSVIFCLFSQELDEVIILFKEDSTGCDLVVETCLWSDSKWLSWDLNLGCISCYECFSEWVPDHLGV